MKRGSGIGIALGCGLVLAVLSLRCENLAERQARQRASRFDAAAYARDLWDNRLPRVLTDVPAATTLLHLFNTDMAGAVTRGQTLGESRVHAYLLQGQGRIVAHDDRGLALALGESPSPPVVLLVTAPFVAGNAIRDASGLVRVGDFSDTMKFNRISTEINRLVADEVTRPYREDPPPVGARVRFVGATEVSEDATESTAFGQAETANGSEPVYHLLPVIPLRLERL